MFNRRNPLDEPGAIQMTAGHLVTRLELGDRFRLVCLPYAFPKTYPPKVGDQWPPIAQAEYDINPGRQAVVLIATEHLAAIGEHYQARPDDHVIVVPEGPR